MHFLYIRTNLRINLSLKSPMKKVQIYVFFADKKRANLRVLRGTLRVQKYYLGNLKHFPAMIGPGEDANKVW